jgi:hypothetical protein
MNPQELIDAHVRKLDLPPEVIEQQRIMRLALGQEPEEPPLVLDDDEEEPHPAPFVPLDQLRPAPNPKQSVYSVPQLIKLLSDAIRRDDKEQPVRFRVKDVPFRYTAPFISQNENVISLFLRRGAYEPFEYGAEVALELDGVKYQTTYAGASATLPGFDYDIVSFVIEPPSS